MHSVFAMRLRRHVQGLRSWAHRWCRPRDGHLPGMPGGDVWVHGASHPLSDRARSHAGITLGVCAQTDGNIDGKAGSLTGRHGGVVVVVVVVVCVCVCVRVCVCVCALNGRLPNRLAAAGGGVSAGAWRGGARSGVPGRCLHFAPPRD